MKQVCRLISNFAGGMEAGALWRLCASSRLANHRSVFHNRQPFQENVNEIRNAVNDFRKIDNLSSKTNVNHNKN